MRKMIEANAAKTVDFRKTKESLLIEARAKKKAIEEEKVTGDNIFRILMHFEKLYALMTEAERRDLMQALIAEIHIHPDPKESGQWLKSIKLKLPIIEENMRVYLDNGDGVGTVVLLRRVI